MPFFRVPFGEAEEEELTEIGDRLERVVRECLELDDHDKIRSIIDQLRHDFAYSVHMPHARNGGLIGLAAASIALGPVG